jgi:hypothetical protein
MLLASIIFGALGTALLVFGDKDPRSHWQTENGSEEG